MQKGGVRRRVLDPREGEGRGVEGAGDEERQVGEERREVGEGGRREEEGRRLGVGRVREERGEEEEYIEERLGELVVGDGGRYC